MKQKEEMADLEAQENKMDMISDICKVLERGECISTVSTSNQYIIDIDDSDWLIRPAVALMFIRLRDRSFLDSGIVMVAYDNEGFAFRITDMIEDKHKTFLADRLPDRTSYEGKLLLRAELEQDEYDNQDDAWDSIVKEAKGVGIKTE